MFLASQAYGVALKMAIFPSTTSVQTQNISATIGWIAMKCCTDIRGPQRMNPNVFGDPLTFHLAPPLG